MEQQPGNLRPLSYAALSLTVAVLAAPALASASTVSVSSGGLDSGGLCALGSICPAQPVDGYSYTSGGAVRGTLDYNSTTDTADFSFTLTSNTLFGGETLLAGSTFSASGINVTVTPGTKGTETISLAAPAVDATTSNVQFTSPALTLSQNDPLVSALTCSLSATSGQCGVSIGSVNGAGAALQFVDTSNHLYNAYLTFNTSVVPVPLPATFPLLLTGLAGLGALGRRRIKT